MEDLKIEEIDLLIRGLDAIPENANLSETVRVFIMAATLGPVEGKAELRRTAERLRQNRAMEPEDGLKIQVLKGKLSAEKLRMLRANPFAGMESVNLNKDGDPK